MRNGRIGLVAAAPLLLSACLFGGGDRPEPRRTATKSATARAPARPSAETRQCLAELDRYSVEYRALPRQDFGGGCVVVGAVQLLDIGVPVSGLTSMRCPLARNFSNWVRFAVAPAARQVMGSDLVRIESYGTFNCRPIAGSGRLSEHGRANAVDVATFVLADGRRVSVLGGWRGDSDERRFLRVIFQSACKRFTTALGPEYNRAHANHFHLDMGGRPLCR
ncbi:extensin family protein [Sphingomonas sp.]|uniref:extensin family protein n=1 Tax=Sphingomonas sp. TaxID=28214 RepID=UPI002C869C80|nr:extensin family protein [Sphingomonas sp.]HTG38644.1 extensin family protein [Sphingomonas sp.]